MTKTDKIFADADALAGRIATITYAKRQKIRKAFESENVTIVKRSTFQVRVGVEYGNQAVIKEGHETGAIQKVGLPESLEKISRSRYWNKKREVDVLAVAPVANANSPRKTEWLLNGEEVPFSVIGQDGLNINTEKSHLQKIF